MATKTKKKNQKSKDLFTALEILQMNEMIDHKTLHKDDHQCLEKILGATYRERLQTALYFLGNGRKKKKLQNLIVSNFDNDEGLQQHQIKGLKEEGEQMQSSLQDPIIKTEMQEEDFDLKLDTLVREHLTSVTNENYQSDSQKQDSYQQIRQKMTFARNQAKQEEEALDEKVLVVVGKIIAAQEIITPFIIKDNKIPMYLDMLEWPNEENLRKIIDCLNNKPMDVQVILNEVIKEYNILCAGFRATTYLFGRMDSSRDSVYYSDLIWIKAIYTQNILEAEQELSAFNPNNDREIFGWGDFQDSLEYVFREK